MKKRMIVYLTLAIALCFVLPSTAMAATGWITASDGGAFYLNVIRPERGLQIGCNESLRLRFQVKGDNPNEKFAVFVTSDQVNNYGKVSNQTILTQLTGKQILAEHNQLANMASLYTDVSINLPNGNYHLWLQYFNGNNTSQSAHTYIPITITDVAEWKQQGNDWCLYRGGKALTGWQHSHGNYYYLDSGGRMRKGWINDGGKWYYLNSGGKLTTGWIKDGGKWYFTDQTGVMLGGWQIIDGNQYLLGSGGDMKTGWQKQGSTWYYLKGNGAMATGWERIGGKWYYLDGSGAMKTGWQFIGGKWYYLENGGAMKVGWLKLGNTWYYFNNSGVMLTGTHNINGRNYTFSASGAWVS